jgi:membrane protease subunit HflC
MENKFVKILISFFVLALLMLNSLFILRQDQQAIILQFGELVRVTSEPGLNFKVPFIQNLIYYDKKVLNVSAEEKELIAKDQKRVIISAYAKFIIDNPLKFYQTVISVKGLEARVNNILDSSLRQVIGDEILAALLTDKRARMVERIREIVAKESKKFGINIIDVRILRVDLPDENSAAIYSRMQSDREKEAKEIRAEGEQEAQIIRATSDKERTIILAEAEKRAQIIKGDGDASATKIYADAFKVDPEFYKFYRSLESYKKTFKKENTKLYLSTKDKYFEYLN